MKTVLFILTLLLLSLPAQAGAPDCTDTTHITSPTDLQASTECFISVETPSAQMGYTRVRLPNNPSIGDEFTLTENSEYLTDSGSYFDEDLQEYVPYSVNYTGGVGFSASHFDDGTQQFVPNAAMILAPYGLVDEAATFSPGDYLRVVFTGDSWYLTGSGL